MPLITWASEHTRTRGQEYARACALTRPRRRGKQARGNKRNDRLNRQDTGGKPAIKRGSRPLMSVQHSRVCLSVITKVNTQRIPRHTAEWARAHARAKKSADE